MKIVIVGNPNSGKTTLFNQLTGGRQKVGNWPGVTVDIKSGDYLHLGKSINVIDLPGIYSLSTSSIDEQVARDYILNNKPDLIVNIVNADSLERNMYLTSQLIEMKVPFIIALNMMDIVRQKKINIKTDELSQLLDCKVISIVANKKKGIDELKDIINNKIEEKNIPSICISFPEEIEQGIEQVSTLIANSDNFKDYDKRWASIKLLEGDLSINEDNKELKDAAMSINNGIEGILGDTVDLFIADSRYGFVHSVCKKVVDDSKRIRKDISDIVDKFVLNKFLGIPIFFLAMYITFWITINLGGVFIDFFDQFFGAIFVRGFGTLLDGIHTPVFLKTLLADGLGGGIQTVSTFVSPIFFMFFCLAILEDSGYMARAAFIMDGLMRTIGLPGKAFIPMLVGFGCNVPAIMATRTLGNRRDRTLAIMMNPLMSCGARMPVYALFTAAFFPRNGGVIVLALYLIGIGLSIMTAFILKNTLLKGEPSTFIMELPPYHMPTLKGILIHSWHRLRSFILRAGKAILIVVIGLSFLNSLGIDGTFGNENTEKSFLSNVGKKMMPIFSPMGLKKDNWPASVGIISGVFAKEAVIGTLDSLYSNIDNYSNLHKDKTNSLFSDIKEAFFTIPRNLSGLTLPFSVSGLLGSDVDTSFDDLSVNKAMYKSMNNRFDGKAGAFAYLLLVLIYMPCIAAMSAVYKELNLKWAIFCATYLSGLAWIVSTLFYQAATLYRHPISSIQWIFFPLIIFLSFILILKAVSRREKVI